MEAMEVEAHDGAESLPPLSGAGAEAAGDNCASTQISHVMEAEAEATREMPDGRGVWVVVSSSDSARGAGGALLSIAGRWLTGLFSAALELKWLHGLWQKEKYIR
eukprot:755872-Hanusia_phi.AAC.4